MANISKEYLFTAILAGSTTCQCCGSMQYYAGLRHEPLNFLETPLGTHGHQAGAEFQRKGCSCSWPPLCSCLRLLFSLFISFLFSSLLCCIVRYRKLEPGSWNPESRVPGPGWSPGTPMTLFPSFHTRYLESRLPNAGRKCFESSCAWSNFLHVLPPISLGFDLHYQVGAVRLRFLYSHQRISWLSVLHR
jgi:hypothetical protein